MFGNFLLLDKHLCEINTDPFEADYTLPGQPVGLAVAFGVKGPSGSCLTL